MFRAEPNSERSFVRSFRIRFVHDIAFVFFPLFVTLGCTVVVPTRRCASDGLSIILSSVIYILVFESASATMWNGFMMLIMSFFRL